MPLPIVPYTLGSQYTDRATAHEIETHEVSDYISTKAQELKSTARDSLTDIVGGVMQVVNKAMPAALAACASVQFRGTQGSFLAFITNIRLTARFISISDDRSDFIGYPCERVVALGQLAGFTLCENATISISGTVIEEEAIEDLLNKGVFIEA